MSRRNGRRLDLKLNLSQPSRTTNQQRFVNSSPSRSPSPPSSCVSSDDMSQDEQMLAYSSSPEAATSMVLVGCPRCLMYVMLIAEEDPKCPKCKSTVLLEFMKNGGNNDDASSGDKAAAGAPQEQQP